MSRTGAGNRFQTGGIARASTRQPAKRRFKKPLKHGIPNIMLSDHTRIKREVPNFQDGVDYTPRELLLLAEKMLIEDPRPVNEVPHILLIPHLRDRQRREIYCQGGTPDPSIVEGLYWRTHPQGRRFRSKEERAEDPTLSFYR